MQRMQITSLHVDSFGTNVQITAINPHNGSATTFAIPRDKEWIRNLKIGQTIYIELNTPPNESFLSDSAPIAPINVDLKVESNFGAPAFSIAGIPEVKIEWPSILDTPISTTNPPPWKKSADDRNNPHVYNPENPNHQTVIRGVLFHKGTTLPNGNTLSTANRKCRDCGKQGLHWETRFGPNESYDRSPRLIYALFDADANIHDCHKEKWMGAFGKMSMLGEQFMWRVDEPVFLPENFDYCFTCQRKYDITHSCACKEPS